MNELGQFRKTIQTNYYTPIDSIKTNDALFNRTNGKFIGILLVYIKPFQLSWNYETTIQQINFKNDDNISLRKLEIITQRLYREFRE